MPGKKLYKKLCMKQWGVILSTGLAAMLVSGCQAWLVEETPYSLPPTRIPSPTPTGTPAVPTPLPPTATPTITLTPLYSPTPPLGPTSTPSEAQMTAAALEPALANAPVIGYFVAFPEEIDPEEEVLLFWSVEGGISAAIYRLNLDGSPGHTWEVDSEGSLTVVPVLKGRDEIYVLAVTNGVVTVESRVAVSVSCPNTWFFDPPPEEGCPEPEITITQATTQQFEHGRMIWIEATNQVLILFDLALEPLAPGEATEEATEEPTEEATAETEEGEEEAGEEEAGEGDEDEGEEEEGPPPAWLMLPNPFVEGQPEDESTLEVPEGFVQPHRGFGMVWREIPEIRERLGWATGEEMAFTMTSQVELIPEGDILYFTDELGAIIMLGSGGTGWQVLGYR